eukprot:760732-Prymnesium_polylepis.1
MCIRDRVSTSKGVCTSCSCARRGRRWERLGSTRAATAAAVHCPALQPVERVAMITIQQYPDSPAH